MTYSNSRKTFPAASAVIALTAGLGAPAFAQTTDAQRIAELEARVAALEESGNEPLSFGLGPNTTLEFYGYFKTDFIYDFDFDLGNTTFGLVSIGARDPDTGELLVSDDGGFTGTVNQTRLGFRTTTQTALGELGTQVELDFYGAETAFSDGEAEPRLRHATATLGGFRVGKYWTTFMPLSSYPSTLDFQGVVGIPFARQEQLRYTHEFGNGFVGEVAIEDHNTGSEDPVFVAAMAYDTDPLLLRLSGITGSIDDQTGDDENFYGVNVSTSAQLWQGATLDAAYTYGEGIASYLVFLGDDVDANGDLIEVETAYAGLTQEVGEKWTFRGIYGVRENKSGAPNGTERLRSVHLNAEYQLLENATLGVEYFNGEREEFGGDTYDTDRIQTSFQINF